MLGDLTGFGIGYFDFDESHGYVRTATEVSSDNSALMRNIRRHENALEDPSAAIARAVVAVSREFGETIPDEGCMRVQYDDSIIQDTAAEKAQDMAEVGVTMHPWEYRQKWYGEDDYKNPLNNSFHVVNQWTFVEYSEKRPDVIVFVNGMPLVVFELKSPSREETDASHKFRAARGTAPNVGAVPLFCGHTAD